MLRPLSSNSEQTLLNHFIKPCYIIIYYKSATKGPSQDWRLCWETVKSKICGYLLSACHGFMGKKQVMVPISIEAREVKRCIKNYDTHYAYILTIASTESPYGVGFEVYTSQFRVDGYLFFRNWIDRRHCSLLLELSYVLFSS